MIKKIVCLLLSVAIMAPLGLVCSAQEVLMNNKSYYEKLIKKEVDYISSLALSNGSIGMEAPKVSSYSEFTSLPDVNGVKASEYTKWKSVKIMPYFSSFAALGVIEASETLGNEKGKETVLNYINWYISRMNTAQSDINGVKGTVYDYFTFISNDGKILELDFAKAYPSHKDEAWRKMNYDSTDSYASIFLELLYEYTRVYDKDFLKDKKATVDTLIEVIKATYIPSLNLTGAKPDYMVAYLMDNCEVYKGLLCAEKIYKEIYSDSEAANMCADYAENIKTALLKSFWDDSNKAFSAGVFEDGKLAYGTTDKDMKVFYPNATSQLFPIIFGLIDPKEEKAKLLYDRFNKEFGQVGVKGKNWVTVDTGDSYPWAIIGRAAILMSDTGRACDYVRTIDSKYISNNHAYPYYNAEAGHMLIILCELFKIASAKEESNTSVISEITSSADTSSKVVNNSADSVSGIINTGRNKALPWIFAAVGAAVAGLGIFAILKLKNKHK